MVHKQHTPHNKTFILFNFNNFNCINISLILMHQLLILLINFYFPIINHRLYVRHEYDCGYIALPFGWLHRLLAVGGLAKQSQGERIFWVRYARIHKTLSYNKFIGIWHYDTVTCSFLPIRILTAVSDFFLVLFLV